MSTGIVIGRLTPAGSPEWANRRAHGWFSVACLFSLLLFHSPLQALASLALHDDRYSITLAIPLLSLGLIWLKKREIFAETRFSLRAGVPVELASLALLAAGWRLDSLALEVSAAIVFWVGAFVCCYGAASVRAAMLPLVLLIVTIPLPSAFLDRVVAALQAGSSEVAYRLFRLAGVPVFREALCRFSLPGVTVEVASECSGIRSSLSLVVCSIAAGYLFLRSGRDRLALAILAIPIAIFKNAARVVTISLLGTYVDPAFLHGRLHQYSGLPFSFLALLLLTPILLGLMRRERGGKQVGRVA